MKDRQLTLIICKTACSFYKPGKEDLLCEGYRYLSRTYSAAELARNMRSCEMNASFSGGYESYANPSLDELLCDHCDFRIDGCDFAEDRSGPPCGGYIIAGKLRQGSDTSLSETPE